MIDQRNANSRAGRWPLLALLVGLVVWLWPLGLGGKLPVGGDVTQFSLGLMAVLQRSIRAGRLPLWNGLWGYGFPGLAESQMGVFYPPHLVLYGLLPLEVAYTVSLVLHTFWGGLGAAWAARRFGVSPWGAALAGFCWATSGFFLIHLPHQWSYTTGSWMPWAWGLAWCIAEGSGTWRTPRALAVVLALQVLPGHFQLAFCTQVGVLVLAACGLWEHRAEGRTALARFGSVGLSMLAVVPLAAMQLWPTYRLARLAATHRDYEYLSGFAATPLHLVSLVAPGLFHWSPLWRPVAWDPFHTSPEEHLAYIGLAPLFLAFGGIWVAWKQGGAARALSILAAVTLALSLGPYLPGFAIWSHIPGFSFFRAPARWTLATSLALAILAGKGFDLLETWPRPQRALVRFVAVAIALPVLIVSAFELALASTQGEGWPAVAGLFERARHVLPWTDDPPFRQVMALARSPQSEIRVRAGLAREGFAPVVGAGAVLSDERFTIYAHELAESAGLGLALLLVAAFVRRPARLRIVLLGLTALDLWAVARHRPTDIGPVRPLASQSPIVGRLASRPIGTRTIDEMRNLPMVVGAGPVLAYRTLDLPAMESLSALAHGQFGRRETDPAILAALRAAGVGVRVFGPFELSGPLRQSLETGRAGKAETLRDPVLAGWLFGADWIKTSAGSQATRFTVWDLPGPRARAWFVADAPGRSLSSLTANRGDPARVLQVLQAATPLAMTGPRPEVQEIVVRADRPGTVIVSQLDYPEWQARRSGPSGERPAPILRVFDGWQAVLVPGAGRWTFQLRYRGDDVKMGLVISGLAWLLGLADFSWSWRRRRVLKGEPT